MRLLLLCCLIALIAVAGVATPTAAANTTTAPATTATNTTANATATTPTPTTTASTASTTPPTSTPTETPTTTTTTASARTLPGDGSTLQNTANITMTDDARITGWEFTNDRVKIAVTADSLTTVTITDGAAGLDDAGATRIPSTTHRVWGGETTIITMPVATAFGGHVVGVADGDAGVRLSTEMQQGQDPLRYFGGTSGLFSGIGITILTSLIGAVYVLRKEESGVRKA